MNPNGVHRCDWWYPTPLSTGPLKQSMFPDLLGVLVLFAGFRTSHNRIPARIIFKSSVAWFYAGCSRPKPFATSYSDSSSVSVIGSKTVVAAEASRASSLGVISGSVGPAAVLDHTSSRA